MVLCVPSGKMISAVDSAAIVSGRIEQSYDEVVAKRLSDYMGIIFEEMCRDYILYYDNLLPFNMSEIGQWWGGNPKTKKQAQIDVVVTSADVCGSLSPPPPDSSRGISAHSQLTPRSRPVPVKMNRSSSIF